MDWWVHGMDIRTGVREWKGEWVDGWMVGRLDGQTDGQTDEGLAYMSESSELDSSPWPSDFQRR